jgi:hypothetical protein
MTANAQQPAIQAFIDSLSPVERHRVCRALNASCEAEGLEGVWWDKAFNAPTWLAYDVEWLQYIYRHMK